MSFAPPQYFSRFSRTLSTSGGNLPHWTQRCATFVTFRLADSLPQEKLAQYEAERAEWLKAHAPSRRDLPIASEKDSIPPHSAAPSRRDLPIASEKDGIPPHSAAPSRRDLLIASEKDGNLPLTDAIRRSRLLEWDEKTQAEYLELFPRRFEKWLDAGSGSCALKDERVREIVTETMRHSNGIRYTIYAFVVMPNHVHVLFMPEEGSDGREIVRAWKRISARLVNRLLGRDGQLWQKESYDHLVRNVDEFNAIRSYIRNNDLNLAWDAYEAQSAT